jgi:predicted nucleic acid-binding protein
VPVVSDCSPLRYFILIGHAEVIPQVLGEITIPCAVKMELMHESAPGAVRSWIQNPPSWLRTTAPRDAVDPVLADLLDSGESEAIQLALDIEADFILIDEFRGRREARRRGLRTIGALGVILEAHRLGIVETPEKLLAELRREGFRISARLIAEFESLLMHSAGAEFRKVQDD